MKKLALIIGLCAPMQGAVLNWHAEMTPSFVGSASTGSGLFTASWNTDTDIMQARWSWTGLTDPEWIFAFSELGGWSIGEGSLSGSWPSDSYRDKNLWAPTWSVIFDNDIGIVTINDANKVPIIGGRVLPGGGPNIPEVTWFPVMCLGLLGFALLRKRAVIIGALCLSVLPIKAQNIDGTGTVVTETKETITINPSVLRYEVRYQLVPSVKKGVVTTSTSSSRLVAIIVYPRAYRDTQGNLIFDLSKIEELDVTDFWETRIYAQESFDPARVPAAASGKPLAILPRKGSLAMLLANQARVFNNP